jgi:hypothetical protein
LDATVVTRWSLSLCHVQAPTMSSEDEWTSILQGHPIFTPLSSEEHHRQDASRTLVLSTDTLTKFIATEPTEDERVPAGRRQVMVLKDADLIVAVGKEIRICSLGDARHNRDAKKTYKVRLLLQLGFVCSLIPTNRPYTRPTFNLRSTTWL